MAKKVVFNERTGMFEEVETHSGSKIVGGILVAVGVLAILFFIGRHKIDSMIETESETRSMYVMAEHLNFRQSPGTQGKIQAAATYGEEVTILNVDESIWARVSYNGQEGYMSLNGLLTAEGFQKLEAVWGDEQIRKNVYALNDRKALVAFASELEPSDSYKLYYKARRQQFYWSGKLSGKHIFAFVLVDQAKHQSCAAVYSFTDDNPVCEKQEMKLSTPRCIRNVSYRQGNYYIHYQ
jgi:uncharacterized protein YgiM (DUF1202 family)